MEQTVIVRCVTIFFVLVGNTRLDLLNFSFLSGTNRHYRSELQSPKFEILKTYRSRGGRTNYTQITNKQYAKQRKSSLAIQTKKVKTN